MSDARGPLQQTSTTSRRPTKRRRFDNRSTAMLFEEARAGCKDLKGGLSRLEDAYGVVEATLRDLDSTPTSRERVSTRLDSLAVERQLQAMLRSIDDRSAAGPSARPEARDPRWQLDWAFAAFARDYPQYKTTSRLDELRATEYSRLDRLGHTYLDYTGGALYSERQLREHLELLQNGVFGNPHSKNLTSMAMTELVEGTRERVLRYFNASPDEYMCVFTQNSTGALKIVGEAYPFAPGSTYVLTFDNHNSVNGIREFAKSKGAAVHYVPIVAPDMRVDTERLAQALDGAVHGRDNLFAFPAQSNFTGVQHPLEWIAEAQAKGFDVLVDAAAFAPSNRLDLGRWHPDFVDISFYKIFGYPTGSGCLLVRKSAARKLVRPWYSGGTITFSSVVANDHYLTPGPERFEDGTVNYLSIPAVDIGLRYIESIGIDTIHTRVECLTGWLIERLTSLRHSNGKPVVRLYGPASTHMRGGTVQVNFFDADGNMLDCNAVEKLANEEKISLRAGCHCNPGAREVAIGFSEQDLAPCFRDKEQMTFEQFIHVIDGKTTGALRASIGLASNFADVYRYGQFAARFVDYQQDLGSVVRRLAPSPEPKAAPKPAAAKPTAARAPRPDPRPTIKVEVPRLPRRMVWPPEA